MAHGERAERRWGREYWSRRGSVGRGGIPWGRFGKWLTHRRERREARRVEIEAKRVTSLQNDTEN